MKLQTDSLIRRVTGAPPNFSGKTPFGWINLLTSLSPCRKISNTLTIFTPPAVDPAQPPANADSNKRKGIPLGHSLKFCVVKPVVVAIEIVWNKPSLKGVADATEFVVSNPQTINPPTARNKRYDLVSTSEK